MKSSIAIIALVSLVAAAPQPKSDNISKNMQSTTYTLEVTETAKFVCGEGLFASITRLVLVQY
jgi:hypothetical protein